MRHRLLSCGSVVLVVACGGSVDNGNNPAGGAGMPAGNGGMTGAGGQAQGGQLSTGSTPFAGNVGGVNAGGYSSAGAGNVANAGSGNVGNAGSVGLCNSANDCTLSTDCCSCFAAGPGEATTLCKSICTQTACQVLGIAASEMACIAGRCVFSRSCDTRSVLCNAIPPACPSGEAASVVGNCYGSCIPISECSAVASCSDCESVGLACVTEENVYGPIYHCASTPAECVQNPTCACMKVCTPGLQCLYPNLTDLYCICPLC
jgi:hypothetical protein